MSNKCRYLYVRYCVCCRQAQLRGAGQEEGAVERNGNWIVRDFRISM